MATETTQYQERGLEKTPEKTPEVTPVRTPENVGHLSGGEVNQLNIAGREPGK